MNGANVNNNINVNRNTNVNIDAGDNWDGFDNDWDGDDWDDDDHHPVAAAMAISATAAVIGSIVNQPPANCVPVVQGRRSGDRRPWTLRGGPAPPSLPIR